MNQEIGTTVSGVIGVMMGTRYAKVTGTLIDDQARGRYKRYKPSDHDADHGRMDR